MAKDFADINRLEHEAGIQAPEASPKGELVNKFVKAWENQTTRRAVKGGTGMTMALTLAACGSDSDEDPSPREVTNLFELVDDGITALTGADPVVDVPNPTAGADALATTIGGDGTGTIELRFEDAEDVVTLDAASDLSGYDTLAITAGTVDVTGVELSGITSITVSSGVTLTAAQFLALDNGVIGGSTDSSVSIIVSTAAEAADVIAATASLSGTFATNGLVIQGAEGSGITAGQAEGFTADLEAAIEAAATVDALPEAIQAVVDAAAAQDAFVETALANEDIAAANPGATADNTAFDTVDDYIDDAEDRAFNDINNALPQGDIAFDGTNSAAIVAEFDDIIGTATTGLTGDLNVAQDALDAIDPELVTLANTVIDAQDVLDQAEADLLAATEAVSSAITAAQTDAEGASTLPQDAGPGAGLEFTIDVDSGVATLTYNEDYMPYPQDIIDMGGTPVIIGETLPNVGFSLNAAVTLSEDGTEYTVAGATFDKAELDAVVTAARAQITADAAQGEAETALTDAQTALDAAEALADQGVDGTPAATAGNDYIVAEGELATATAAKAAFEAAVADYDSLVALQEQSTALVDGFDVAVAGIKNAPDADPAGLGIDILEANNNAVVFDEVGESDELYSFDAADAGGNTNVLTVTSFDADGSDRLYMGAGEYSFVELAETDTIPVDNLGSATALEILAEETAVGVTLWVEQVATAGNGTTDSDMIQVKVDGLDLADLSFDAANGILTAETTTLIA